MTAEQIVELTLVAAQLADEPGGLQIDAEHTKFWSPFGVCLLATALEQRRLRGWPWPGLVPPAEPSCARFLTETSMARFLRGAGAPPPADDGDTLRLRHFRSLDPAWPDRIARWLAQQVGGGEDVAYVVEMDLIELLTNAFDHALSGVGCFALARYYARDGNVRLAVVDGGIGIPSAVRRHFPASVGDDDARLIERAVRETGLTTRPAGRPGGLGLKNIVGGLVDRRDSLTVVSGSAAVRFGGEARVERVEFFHGTAVELDFRPQVAP